MAESHPLVLALGMTWVLPLLVVTAKDALARRSSMISGGKSRSASIMTRSSTCAASGTAEGRMSTQKILQS